MIDKNMNILIVEDEVISSAYLENILQNIGYNNIYEASNFEEALNIINMHKIDLAFMDININGSIDGIESAKLLNNKYFLPIVYTTAYKDEETMIEASETNVFGYLIKPFEKNEVQISLMIALKRIVQLNKNKVSKENKNIENIVILNNNQKYDLKSKTFYINNNVISLTKKENEILFLLCKNLNQNISYDTLIEYVWENKNISNSTIRDTISRLKRKIPSLEIETIINFGYILKK